MICAHSLAVAEQELCLPEFLALVGKRMNEPDSYQLVGNEERQNQREKRSTYGDSALPYSYHNKQPSG